jgi:hypothetical protein
MVGGATRGFDKPEFSGKKINFLLYFQSLENKNSRLKINKS